MLSVIRVPVPGLTHTRYLPGQRRYYLAVHCWGSVTLAFQPRKLRHVAIEMPATWPCALLRRQPAISVKYTTFPCEEGMRILQYHHTHSLHHSTVDHPTWVPVSGFIPSLPFQSHFSSCCIFASFQPKVSPFCFTLFTAISVVFFRPASGREISLAFGLLGYIVGVSIQVWIMGLG